MQNKILSEAVLFRLKTIHKLSQDYNRKLKKNHRKRLMTLMKEHVDEIDELCQEDNPHYLTETGDLIILCMELLLEEGISIDTILEKCFSRYEKKLPYLIKNVKPDDCFH